MFKPRITTFNDLENEKSIFTIMLLRYFFSGI
jgi:hypothetical protein